MHWKIKAAIQSTLAILPAGEWLHFQMQKRLGGLRDFNREFDIKMSDWEIMVRRLGEAGVTLPGIRLFEVGSGWYPTFPLACYLAGASHVTTVDLNRHMRPALLLACAERMGASLSLIADTVNVDRDCIRERHARMLESLRRTGDLAEASNGVIHYRAPLDATQTGLGEAQFDCIFSNSVLEHVPPDVIDAMYVEAMRLLDIGGVMFHSVNCGDHYAYFDRSINQLHYLRYSAAQWSRWNNAFLYQNRLRAHVFVERAEAAGFEIVLNTAKASEQRLSQLAATPVHAEFSGIPAERLCITSVDFIGRKTMMHNT